MTVLFILYAVIRILWESYERAQAEAYVQEQKRLYPEHFSGERYKLKR